MKYKNLIAVIGADGGLGSALAQSLMADSNNLVIPINGAACRKSIRFDFNDNDAAYSAAELIRVMTQDYLQADALADDYTPILVNCVGVNYIEWFPQAKLATEFERLMRINVLSHLLLVQELIGSHPPLSDAEASVHNWFQDRGTLVEIISNASHMPMTNSVIYNATKGAQHIATLALGRELKKTHNLTVFGVSPNKLAGTGMSRYIEDRVPELRGWTPAQAAGYQLASLPAGEETDPVQLAGFLAHLLGAPERHKYLANTVIPYGA